MYVPSTLHCMCKNCATIIFMLDLCFLDVRGDSEGMILGFAFCHNIHSLEERKILSLRS